ncbi:MAG: hypothetical protein APR53_02360 [Methanoculleus sp. SDB]|nr:MAG: hypothetical protein APR53_02360 [Methanoculleus sp. SDB]
MNRILSLLLLVGIATAVCTGCVGDPDRPGGPVQDRDRVSQTLEHSGICVPPGNDGGDDASCGAIPDSFSPRSSLLSYHRSF